MEKEKKVIPMFYWPAFIGGRFTSIQQFLQRFPEVKEGIIQNIALYSEILVITYDLGEKIELDLDLYDIVGTPLDEKITFDSFVNGHFVEFHISQNKN